MLDLPLSREYFLSLFMKEGLEPRITERSTHQDAIRTMVANGYGYTLANVRPRSDVAMDGRHVKRIDLAGDHRPMILGIATLRQARKSRLIEAFETHCKSFISDSYIPGMVAPGSVRSSAAHGRSCVPSMTRGQRAAEVATRRRTEAVMAGTTIVRLSHA